MIRTRFGVVIPPWRAKRPNNCITMEFVLTGKIPSEKHRRRASFNYSWAAGQIRSFFREMKQDQVSKDQVTKFLMNLIKNIKPFIYKPKPVADWEANAGQILVGQAAEWKKSFASKGLSFPIAECQISIKHYWADDVRRDNTNREQTIHDVMVKAGLIVDDNYKCLFRNVSEADNYKDEIVDHITLIHLTAYRW